VRAQSADALPPARATQQAQGHGAWQPVVLRTRPRAMLPAAPCT
jgi:hypothetical protein